MANVDPGYGDPNAPIGSVEWAKRWRLDFQGIAKRLPAAPEQGAMFLEIGKQHRAWTLITDADGEHFRTWEAFCAYRQPWGLGMDPVKFDAFLRAARGDREVDLLTVAPDGRASNGANQHTGPREESPHRAEKATRDKETRLRAILRAPEQVQDLYREGLIRQTDAAKLGPRSPTPEQAAAIVQARERIEAIDRDIPAREFRKRAGEVVREALGVRERTALDHLRDWWAKASDEERETFLAEIH